MKEACIIKTVDQENIKMNPGDRKYLDLVSLASYFRTRVVEIEDSWV
jgi:hypothetical protein